MKLSPSSMSRFLNCPYSYYLRYFKNIKFESNDAAVFGSVVHKVNEKFWLEYLTNSDALKAMQSSIDIYWKGVSPEYEKVAHDCFNNFLSIFEENKTIPLFTELKCDNNTNNTISIIDAVFSDKIVDYKTSTIYTKKPKLNNIIQATMCSENLKECFGLDVRHVEFQYLRFKKYQIVDVTEQMIKDTNIMISQIRDKIENNKFPKNKTSCFMCEFKLICNTEEKMIEKKCSGCFKTYID